MDRRSFVKTLFGGLIASHELDVERLLWVPRERTIFIPPPRPKPALIRATLEFSLDGRKWIPEADIQGNPLSLRSYQFIDAPAARSSVVRWRAVRPSIQGDFVANSGFVSN
jgi:hypothetical protein